MDAHRSRRSLHAPWVAIALILGACGGGGSGSHPGSPDTPRDEPDIGTQVRNLAGELGLDADPDRDCFPALDWCGPNVLRNSLSTFNNSLYRDSLLHDGRVARIGEQPDGVPVIRTPESGNVGDTHAQGDLLIAQAILPVVNDNEMRGYGYRDHADPASFRALLVSRLKGQAAAGPDTVTTAEAGQWEGRFRAAFPGAVDSALGSFGQIQQALAAYQRSQTFVDTPWSRFLDPRGALSGQFSRRSPAHAGSDGA